MRAYAHRHSADTSRTGNSIAGGRLLRSFHTQPTSGNQALQRLLKSPSSLQSKYRGNAGSASAHLHRYVDSAIYAAAPISVQPKLEINKPGDAYEQEADRVANEVMGTSQPELQRSCDCAGECSECQRKPAATALQMKRNTPGQADGVAPPIVHDVVQSSGQALDANTRNFMEPRFGYDFSGVRIHSDARAAESAHAVGAKAYTVGKHIALGENQYAPQTNEGRKLLAHELAHVVHQTGGSEGVSRLQRQPAAAKPAKNYPFSVTYSGCDEPPHNKKDIEREIRSAFDRVRTTDCIKNQSLKDDILSAFDGLKIICKQDDLPGTCAQATSAFSQTMNLFASAHRGTCVGILDAVIMHEAVHFTQWSPFIHGTLSWDCQEACFPGTDNLKRGVASRCLHENTFLPFAGISKGTAFSGKGASASYLRLYVGMEKRGPILSFIHPSFGFGLSFIGKPTGGEPTDIPSGSSTLLSLMGALRFDPAKVGGGYVSVSGGLEFGERLDKPRLGAQVGAALGYRWYLFDVSLDAGIEYDPTKIPGEQKMYTLGASLKIGPEVRR